jgi:4-hydroxy-tetrahydrodipicolinate synthase
MVKLEGAFTAMVTPFTEKNEVDEEGFRTNIDFQIEKGISGLVPVGTTGESPTLTQREHERVIEIAVDQINGRVPTIAGAGSNNTVESLHYLKHAADVGADAALVITPYYNKPTQQGLIEHYKTLAEAVDIPIVMYNVPGRTGVNMLPETTAELAKIDNIVAMKNASGSVDQASKEVLLTPDNFTVLSGDDGLTLPMMAVGAKGVISVASNIVPDRVTEMVKLALDGDFDKAREKHFELYNLFKVIFLETNPTPIKAAMKMLGMPAGDPRLPLVPMSDAGSEKMKKVLQDLGLLE